MKKTIAIILVLCLFLGLCACGGKSEPSEQAKSNEAQKADELILAIGKVSLKKESKILAAEAYYNTLSDEQKNQVANTDILEEAIEELNTLKEEKEYEELWERAMEYEKDGYTNRDTTFWIWLSMDDCEIYLDVWADATHTMEWIRSRGIDLKIIEDR